MGILGDMARRDLSGGTRKEDRITDKDNLIERIKEEYDKQNSKTTNKLDLTMLDVSLVEDISRLFETYYDLQFIDVSNWDVSKVESMNSMFEGCRNINIIDVSNWNVSNIENMSGMFFMCNKLKTLDVSKWNVDNVIDMSEMFYGCSSLKSIDVSKWKLNLAEDDIYNMFNGCKFDYELQGNKLVKI